MKKIRIIFVLLMGCIVQNVYSDELPKEYTRLDWIESTGDEYIDTGIDAGATTTIDMSFGRCAYDGTLFGKDVWNPEGFLFIIQKETLRFFGSKGEEPGDAWNLAGLDPAGELDYRLTVDKYNRVSLYSFDGVLLKSLETDRSSESHHSLWLFKADCFNSKYGVFRLYSMKIGTDEGDILRDFVPARRVKDNAVGLYDCVSGTFFENCGDGGFLASDYPRQKWSRERASEWASNNPWYCGFNFVPSNAMNDVEIWMKKTFSPDVIRKELGLASSLGMNCVRIFLQYKVYEDNPKWFLKAFEKFLQLAAEANLKVMPTLFDDCAFGPATDPHVGDQGEPYPGWNMWGWVPSPGHTMVVDSRTHGLLEKYVKELISRYKDDDRIFVWDLYNEPAGSTGIYARYSYDLVRKCFKWARESNPSQPLTVGNWNGDTYLNRICARESDVTSYHAYVDARGTRSRIDGLQKLGRPMICTEWMLRANGCTIENCLGIYKETGVGCMMWGLVNGKSQVHLPFGYHGDQPPYEGPWKHDIFRSDYTPYDEHELELIRQATGVAK